MGEPDMKNIRPLVVAALFLLVFVFIMTACNKKVDSPTGPAVATNTPTPSYTSAFDDTWTPTPTPETPVYTQTPTWSPTPSSPTPIPTNPIVAVTSTPTGCGKVFASSLTLAVGSVTAPVTAAGYEFYILSPNPPCLEKTFTGLTFFTWVTGNLDTEILEARLFRAGVLLQTIPYATHLNFTGSPLCAGTGSSFELQYVLSSAASGTIQTYLNEVFGYEGSNEGTISLSACNGSPSTLTVGP